MTKEEKDLLLKVLCAMLPYGVKVQYNSEIYDIDYISAQYDEVKLDFADNYHVGISEIKPYLRPMPSMSKEEKQESRWYQKDAKSDDFILYMNRYVEWLDSKHFDWRTDGNGKTMIERGLALEAPEGMYNF